MSSVSRPGHAHGGGRGPRAVSFDAAVGACPTCRGLGTRMEVDPELVVPDPDKSIDDGALTPWSAAVVADYFGRVLTALAEELGFKTSTPFRKLSPSVQEVLLNGH